MSRPAASPQSLPASSSLAALARSRSADVVALGAILLIGTIARAWSLWAGVPHAIDPDEAQVIDRAVRILRTGDWNTHLFDQPTLVVYCVVVVAAVRYLAGAIAGQWTSLDLFQVGSVYGPTRIVAAALGILTVWLVYRLGEEIATRRVGLLAAAQLAVFPLHVSESHAARPDVPATALIVLTMWLGVRAAKAGTARAYGIAGVAAGCAAAAEYSGVAAIVAVAAMWLVRERRAPDRGRKAAALAAGAAAAFLVAMPFAVGDLPHFLDGVAGQLAAIARSPRDGAPWLHTRELSWLIAPWLLLAAVGAAVVTWRSRERGRWAPVLLMAAAYGYALVRYPTGAARDALPIVPMLCLFAGAAAVELVRLSRRVPRWHTSWANRAAFLVVSLLVVAPLTLATVGSIRELRRPDTRTATAQWIKEAVPQGSRIVVETGGPTCLEDVPLRVIRTSALSDRPLGWYCEHADYLILSGPDTGSAAAYLNAGPTVFQITPTAQRAGPPIRVVKLHE